MSKCDFEKEQNISEDVWALPVEREKHEEGLAFPKPSSVNDPDPEYQFKHRIADDGSVIPINTQ